MATGGSPTNNSVPVGVAFVGLSDGWSGRVTGGVNVPIAGGGTVALGGEYGGIGSDYGHLDSERAVELAVLIGRPSRSWPSATPIGVAESAATAISAASIPGV